MIDHQQRKELIAEFEELANPNTVLAKEVYAHFGLLFFKFSLVEHSLINALTFHYLGTELATGRIQTRLDWEKAYDLGYGSAIQKTFGNLVRSILEIAEFSSFASELSGIKKSRDFFAHHFFREEVGMYRTDDGCWEVLWAIKKLREKLIDLDGKLEEPTKKMCTRLKIAWPTAEDRARAEGELINEAEGRLATDKPFYWAKYSD